MGVGRHVARIEMLKSALRNTFKAVQPHDALKSSLDLSFESKTETGKEGYWGNFR